MNVNYIWINTFQGRIRQCFILIQCFIAYIKAVFKNTALLYWLDFVLQPLYQLQHADRYEMLVNDIAVRTKSKRHAELLWIAFPEQRTTILFHLCGFSEASTELHTDTAKLSECHLCPMNNVLQIVISPAQKNPTSVWPTCWHYRFALTLQMTILIININPLWTKQYNKSEKNAGQKVITAMATMKRIEIRTLNIMLLPFTYNTKNT